MQKEYLQSLIDQNLSLVDIVKVTGKSNTTTRYWLKKFGLKPIPKYKKNRIWSFSKDEFGQMIKSATCIMDLYEMIYGTRNCSSGMYNRLAKRCMELGFDLSILKHKNRSKAAQKYTTNEIFCKNSKISRSKLKLKIIKENLLEYRCKICNIDPIWNGCKLSLQLDHINGINNDNRLENLRFICPNCHTQTRFKK